VKFHVDEIAIKDGTTGIREIVDHEECSVILPYLEKEDKIVFIEQYRDAVQQSLIELPAGMIQADENAEAAAKRELQEETGYVARSLTHIGDYFTSPGFTNEKHYLFLATRLNRVSDIQDNLEIGNCLSIPRRKVLEMIQKGEIVDGKTILAFFWGERYLKKL
jgi:ADP-ribose pyrophosphatase